MQCDVAVIGAGPAGLAAAAHIAEAVSAQVVLIDEGPAPGGRLRAQLYRREGNWFVGSKEAQTLVHRAEAAGVRIISNRQVWSLDQGFTLGLTGGGVLSADFVVIATGAAEKPLGLPGWTTPGVLAVGAVQSMLNINRLFPGQCLAVVGIDPLSLSIVDELAAAGIGVDGIYLPPPVSRATADDRPSIVFQSLGRLHNLAPNKILAQLMRLLTIPALAEAAARLWPRKGMRIAGMPMHLRECVVAIDGHDEVTGIRVRSVSAVGDPIGPERTVAVDSVCLSGGLYPLQDLTRDAVLVNVPELGGQVPVHSPDLETTVPGLFVAGNITGIESAEVARAQGELAGTAIGVRIANQHTLGNTGTETGNHLGGRARDFEDQSQHLEGQVRNLEIARAAIEEARAATPLTFMPEIETGRGRMEQLWRAHLDDEALT